MADQRARAGDDDELFAELADLVLNVGRLVRARTPAGVDAVPLNETERSVMRVVDLFPGSAPSEIAARTRLQRTNVSTALGSLEAKGLVTREPSEGRGVTVHPTKLAATNLVNLRSAWSAELGSALEGDRASVRRCVDLLSRLERRLIESPTDL
jgi:DNA-binding MarR family transcriptional regulator